MLTFIKLKKWTTWSVSHLVKEPSLLIESKSVNSNCFKSDALKPCIIEFNIRICAEVIVEKLAIL